MADGGYGLSITFSSGFCAEIRSANPGGMVRDALETTHMSSTSGYRTYIGSDLKEPGELQVEMYFRPNVAPPISGATETVTITFPTPAGGSSGATWSCSGFLIASDISVPVDDVMMQNVTIKFSGVPTFTPGT